MIAKNDAVSRYCTLSLILFVLCIASHVYGSPSHFLGLGPTSKQFTFGNDSNKCPCRIQEFSGYGCGDQSMLGAHKINNIVIKWSRIYLLFCFVIMYNQTHNQLLCTTVGHIGLEFGLGCYNLTFNDSYAYSLDIYKCEESEIYFEFFTNGNCTLPPNVTGTVEWQVECTDVPIIPYSFNFVC